MYIWCTCGHKHILYLIISALLWCTPGKLLLVLQRDVTAGLYVQRKLGSAEASMVYAYVQYYPSSPSQKCE